MGPDMLGPPAGTPYPCLQVLSAPLPPLLPSGVPERSTSGATTTPLLEPCLGFTTWCWARCRSQTPLLPSSSCGKHQAPLSPRHPVTMRWATLAGCLGRVAPWVRRGHDAALTKGWLLRALILQERPCRAHSPPPAEGGCSPAAFLSRPGQIFESGLIIRVPIILALQSDRPRCRGDSCPYPHQGFAGSIPGPTSVPVLSAPGCCPRGVPSAGTMSAAAAWSQLGTGPRARRAMGTRSYG